MAEVVVHGTLKPDGTLELNQPVNLPPGEVQVTVRTGMVAPPAGRNVLAVLESIWSERRSQGLKGRSVEQIDADVSAMRDEWEDRQRELDRIQANARDARE